MKKIEVVEIRKSFHLNGRTTEVLDGVSVHAIPSEFVSILGPSGCGKSTLFNIISGLYPPDEGKVLFEGVDVTGKRGIVAYMQQKDLLFPWRRVIENVLLGPELNGLPKESARQEAEELLALFGLKGFENHYPSQLSGGMRQRVALIRTLLFKKDVILLDEPFGALDAMTRTVMQGLLLRVFDEFRKTILFVTHDVEEAILLSDRIYVLSARPARVKEVVRVELPRPRDPTHPRFVEIKRMLLTLIKEEMEEVFQ